MWCQSRQPVELEARVVVIVEVVQPQHLIAALQQRQRHMHADESGSAGDQNLQLAVPLFGAMQHCAGFRLTGSQWTVTRKSRKPPVRRTGHGGYRVGPDHFVTESSGRLTNRRSISSGQGRCSGHTAGSQLASLLVCPAGQLSSPRGPMMPDPQALPECYFQRDREQHAACRLWRRGCI